MVPETAIATAYARVRDRALDTDQAGLAVDRVLHGLQQQQVDAALDQPLGLLLVGVRELVESDAAGDRNGLGRRAHRARNKARPLGRAERRRLAARAIEPARRLISRACRRARTRRARPRSAPKVLVSIMSAPASRKLRCSSLILSGLRDGQGSRCSPRVADRRSRPRVRCMSWMEVPVAPSITTIRSASRSRRSSILSQSASHNSVERALPPRISLSDWHAMGNLAARCRNVLYLLRNSFTNAGCEMCGETACRRSAKEKRR